MNNVISIDKNKRREQRLEKANAEFNQKIRLKFDIRAWSALAVAAYRAKRNTQPK